MNSEYQAEITREEIDEARDDERITDEQHAAFFDIMRGNDSVDAEIEYHAYGGSRGTFFDPPDAPELELQAMHVGEMRDVSMEVRAIVYAVLGKGFIRDEIWDEIS